MGESGCIITTVDEICVDSYLILAVWDSIVAHVYRTGGVAREGFA